MDIELPNDFKEFLKLLNDHGVEYLLIGGYAVGYYGHPRATNDIDVWVARRPENARRIEAALREFGFDVPQLTAEIFMDEGRIVRMGHPPMRIEIINKIAGVNFDACHAVRKVGRVSGIDISIIGLEDLKRNKMAAGRHKDLDDLEHLT